MNRDLKIFFFAVGLPALILALGGLRLLQVEKEHSRFINQVTLQAKADLAAADLSSRIDQVVDGIFDRLVRSRGSGFGPGLGPGPGPGGRARLRPRWGGEEDYLRYLENREPFIRHVWFRPQAPGDSAESRGRGFEMRGDRRVPIMWMRMPEGETNRVAVIEVEPLAVLARLPGWLKANGADSGAGPDPDPGATLAEIRREDGTLLCPASLPTPTSASAEAVLAPPFSDLRVHVYFRAGGGDSVQTARLVVVGGCLLALLFATLVAGGWMLVRAAAKARSLALEQTDFVSNVSHEFKTPLTTICLCAELAEEEDDAARRLEALRSIVDEAGRLSRLVANVLDFSRLERRTRKYVKTAFDLTALVAETAETMRERFLAHGLVLPSQPCTAFADRDAVHQILINLIDNAAKYAAERGAVEIAVRRDGAQAVMTVADRGPGLTDEGLRKVFTRFWRADNSVTRTTGGNGLGLPIAQGLARGMGGDLTAARRAGGGSVFTLTLPAEPSAERTEGEEHG